MAEPPRSDDSDEICSICKKPRSVHTVDEILVCADKLIKLQKKWQEMQELNKN